MFCDLTLQWQKVFSLAWEAYIAGNLPIGAAVFDNSGKLVSDGKNGTREESIKNPRITHAETQCLRNLDLKAHPDFKSYTIYTTMEPCPMCMGTIVMCGIRNVEVAAFDAYCGALHYCGYDPYIRDKSLNIHVLQNEAQAVQLAWQGAKELKHFGGTESKVFVKFRETDNKACDTAHILYKTKYLDEAVEKSLTCQEVYDYIVSLYNNL